MSDFKDLRTLHTHGSGPPHLCRPRYKDGSRCDVTDLLDEVQRLTEEQDHLRELLNGSHATIYQKDAEIQRLTEERDTVKVKYARALARIIQLEAALRGMLDLYGREAAQASEVYAVQQARAALTPQEGTAAALQDHLFIEAQLSPGVCVDCGRTRWFHITPQGTDLRDAEIDALLDKRPKSLDKRPKSPAIGPFLGPKLRPDRTWKIERKSDE